MVAAKSVCFQMPNLIGLAQTVNEIMNSFSITYILCLTNKTVMHHEVMTLVTSVFNLAIE
jgi:hypothetical protein